MRNKNEVKKEGGGNRRIKRGMRRAGRPSVSGSKGCHMGRERNTHNASDAGDGGWTARTHPPTLRWMSPEDIR